MTRPRPPVFIINYHYNRKGLLTKKTRYIELGRRIGPVQRLAWRLSFEGFIHKKEHRLKYQFTQYYTYNRQGLLTERGNCRSHCWGQQYYYTYYLPESR
jgi:hypothetical protein